MWNVTNKRSPLSWGEFEGGLLSVYDHSTSSDYAGKLSKLKQKKMPSEEYMSEFMRFSHFVRGLPEEYLMSCFTSGLKEPNRFEAMAKEPTT